MSGHPLTHARHTDAARNLAYALRYGRIGGHVSGREPLSATLTAEHLAEALRLSRFVVMRTPSHSVALAERESITSSSDASPMVLLQTLDRGKRGAVERRFQAATSNSPAFEAFFAKLPPTEVALEACGGSHHWGRRLMELGHQVRLIPPQYISPSSNAARTTATTPKLFARRLGDRE